MVTIVASVSQQLLLMGEFEKEVRQLNRSFFEQHLMLLEKQLNEVIVVFNYFKSFTGATFDEVWERARQLIVQEARFLILSDPIRNDFLNREWNIIIDRVISKLEEADPTLMYDPDRQILAKFTARNSHMRTQIMYESSQIQQVIIEEIGAMMIQENIAGARYAKAGLVARLKRNTDALLPPRSHLSRF